MTRGPSARPVIKIARPACSAPPDPQWAGDRYLSGRPRTFASEFRPERSAAAASAR
jgi:hypothetical protein